MDSGGDHSGLGGINRVAPLEPRPGVYFPSGALEPLAEFFRFESDKNVLSCLAVDVEKLLQLLVEGYYSLILFI